MEHIISLFWHMELQYGHGIIDTKTLRQQRGLKTHTYRGMTQTRTLQIIIIIIIIIIIKELQKTAILGTAHILRKVLM